MRLAGLLAIPILVYSLASEVEAAECGGVQVEADDACILDATCGAEECSSSAMVSYCSANITGDQCQPPPCAEVPVDLEEVAACSQVCQEQCQPETFACSDYCASSCQMECGTTCPDGDPVCLAACGSTCVSTCTDACDNAASNCASGCTAACEGAVCGVVVQAETAMCVASAFGDCVGGAQQACIDACDTGALFCDDQFLLPDSGLQVCLDAFAEEGIVVEDKRDRAEPEPASTSASCSWSGSTNRSGWLEGLVASIILASFVARRRSNDRRA